jgi:hypothetical protein
MPYIETLYPVKSTSYCLSPQAGHTTRRGSSFHCLPARRCRYAGACTVRTVWVRAQVQRCDQPLIHASDMQRKGGNYETYEYCTSVNCKLRQNTEQEVIERAMSLWPPSRDSFQLSLRLHGLHPQFHECLALLFPCICSSPVYNFRDYSIQLPFIYNTDFCTQATHFQKILKFFKSNFC